jgi:hypothetical protein
MVQVCNKIANLDETQLDAKAALARAATLAVLGAMSDCYKAAEAVEAPDANHAVGPQHVYLRSASTKLDGAITAFVRNGEILGSVQPREEALEWLRNLDYDRLYNEGVRSRMIPANAAQWSRLVDTNRSQGYLGVVDQLIGDTKELQCDINNVLEESAEKTTDAPANEVPVPLAALLAALSNFAAFAQMVGYLNKLTPLDLAWTKEALSVVGTPIA